MEKMKTQWQRHLVGVSAVVLGSLLLGSAIAAPFGVGADSKTTVQGGLPPLPMPDSVQRSSLQVAQSSVLPKHLSVTRGLPPLPEMPSQAKSLLSKAEAKAESVLPVPPVSSNSVVRGASIRDQAFSNASRMLMPMTPSQIETLHQLYAKSQRAIAGSAFTPPKPTTTELALNIAPGSTPPVIRLSAGFVTSVALLDATSSPWPIEWIDVGNPKDYNVQWDKKSNVMIIQALTTYGSANMALKLVGMPTPIMLTLMPGQKVVDYRVDLRVPGIGPNSTSATSSQGLPEMGNPVILSVLNGVPPKHSVALQVAGAPARAWLINNQIYLRTRLTVISPSWITHLSSGDGTHVYVLPVSPIVLAMNHGKMVTLTVKHDG